VAWNYYSDQDDKLSVQREIERRRKRGEKFEKLEAPSGSTKLVKTFWAKSWCQHLEEHSDYEHRLPRGRSYLRQGNVYNLEIGPGRVTSIVAGSSLYEVEVKIKPLPSEAWAQLKTGCAGQVASLLDLLSGRLGEGVLRAISDPDRGLFPKPREIRFSCTCPDHADMWAWVCNWTRSPTCSSSCGAWIPANCSLVQPKILSRKRPVQTLPCKAKTSARSSASN
jgi:hypothetical protein